MNYLIQKLHKCPKCAVVFKTSSPQQRYCSQQCRRPRHPLGRKRPKQWQMARLWKPKQGICKVCGTEYMKTAPCHLYCSSQCKSKSNRDQLHIRKDATQRSKEIRERNLRTKYGLRLEDYEMMVATQNGVCKICKKPPKEGDKLAVDHCHDSQVIRGLLCKSCNLGLGAFSDNPDFLIEAVRYVKGVEAIDNLVKTELDRYLERYD